MASSKRAGTGGCVFCSILSGEKPADHVFADKGTASFLDNRPLFPGHVLVVPRVHHATLPDLPEGLLAPLFGHARMLAQAMVEALGMDGSFIAVNNAVSQSVPHLHVHVVPRRQGDGLKGFFWPRRGYQDDREREKMRQGLAAFMLNHPP